MVEAVINLIAKYFPRSFFVSYFLPLVIGSFALIFFFPIAGLKLFEVPLLQIPTLTLLQVVLPFVLVYWLAYILENNSSGTLELFKGRYLPRFLSRILILRQYRRLRRQEQILHQYQTISEQLEQKSRKKHTDPEEIVALQNMRERLVSGVIGIGSIALLRREEVLPTQLGNVFQAIEYYPMERYGIDNRVVWPELLEVIPAKLEASMKEVINNLFFFLNSSLVMLTLALFALFTVLARAGLSIFVGTVPGTSGLEAEFIRFLEATNSNLFQWNVNYSYLALVVFFLFLGSILYRLSLLTAADYANSVRTVYDLYRFRLLEKGHYRRPRNLEEERILWSRLNEFLGIGRGFDPFHLEYQEEQSPASMRTKSEAIDFGPVAFRGTQSETSSDGKDIHIDLGGITLNLGDLLSDTVKLVRPKPRRARKLTKKSPARKVSSSTRNNSRTKSNR